MRVAGSGEEAPMRRVENLLDRTALSTVPPRVGHGPLMIGVYSFVFRSRNTEMAKIICVLYDDPVDGYPKSYARADLPKIDHYPGRPDAADADGDRFQTGRAAWQRVRRVGPPQIS